MGQYYQAVILADNKVSVKQSIYSHDIKSTYEREDGTTFTCGNFSKLMEHSWMMNEFVGALESLIINKPQRVVWAGDYAKPCKNRKTNLFTRCNSKTSVTPKGQVISIDEYPFLVNHSKKQFIDKRKIKGDKEGWRIHPLPLMTAEGNGQGGGDYFSKHSAELVGTWSRDLISLENTMPKGFVEIKPKFK